MAAEREYDVGALKQKLLDYREEEKEIDGQIERLERITSKMTGVGAPTISDMPKSRNASTDRTADMIARRDELDASIRSAIEKQAEERNHIEGLLKKLRKSDERMVIRMRYIDGESWGDVTDMLYGGRDDYDERQDSYLRRVFQVHGNALTHMAQIVLNEQLLID